MCKVIHKLKNFRLELDSVGVSTKDHVAVLVAWPWLGGGLFAR